MFSARVPHVENRNTSSEMTALSDTVAVATLVAVIVAAAAAVAVVEIIVKVITVAVVVVAVVVETGESFSRETHFYRTQLIIMQETGVK